MRKLSAEAQTQIVGGDFSWKAFAEGAACGIAIGVAAGSGGLAMAGAIFACIAVTPDVR